MTQLSDYYRDRAAEYDAVYAKPERQDDLATLRGLLPTLAAGRTYEILKNFPDRDQFAADIAAVGSDVTWTELPYFWLATFRLR